MSRSTARTFSASPVLKGNVAFAIGRRLRHALATTPGQLRLSLGAMWLLMLLLACSASIALERHRHEMQTVGRDSGPSIIAAQLIKVNIADLHGNVMRQFLGSTAQAREAVKAFPPLREKVTDGLLQAAENITYGSDERGPIRDLLNGLAKYDDAVARATALHEHNTGDWLASVHRATSILDQTLGPAADQLDNANQIAMDRGYKEEQSDAGWSTVMVVFTCLLLLGGCAAVQVLIRRRMHRRISLPIAAIMLLTVVWTAYAVTAMRNETADLKTVKEDAFGSVGVMCRARANAFDAQSHLALALLDPGAAQQADQTFENDTFTLASLSDGNSFASIQSDIDAERKLPPGFGGYISVELNNITFEGEKEAADDMFRRYVHYIGIARTVQETELAHKHAAAVELCLGDSNNQAMGALNSFDSALNDVLKINQVQFELYVDKGFANLAGMWIWNWVVMLICAILAYLAIAQRLGEYA